MTSADHQLIVAYGPGQHMGEAYDMRRLHQILTQAALSGPLRPLTAKQRIYARTKLKGNVNWKGIAAGIHPYKNEDDQTNTMIWFFCIANQTMSIHTQRDVKACMERGLERNTSHTFAHEGFSSSLEIISRATVWLALLLHANAPAFDQRSAAK